MCSIQKIWKGQKNNFCFCSLSFPVYQNLWKIFWFFGGFVEMKRNKDIEWNSILEGKRLPQNENHKYLVMTNFHQHVISTE